MTLRLLPYTSTFQRNRTFKKHCLEAGLEEHGCLKSVSGAWTILTRVCLHLELEQLQY